MSRQAAERRGRWAEILALFYLRFKGYRLLARRFKCTAGEIDLIMRRGETTAFIEVKARRSTDEAIIAVSPYQARRIVAASSVWMKRDHKAARGVCRYDIVAVSPLLRIVHIPNAFEGR